MVVFTTIYLAIQHFEMYAWLGLTVRMWTYISPAFTSLTNYTPSFSVSVCFPIVLILPESSQSVKNFSPSPLHVSIQGITITIMNARVITYFKRCVTD